jgi:hypothetical protein
VTQTVVLNAPVVQTQLIKPAATDALPLAQRTLQQMELL